MVVLEDCELEVVVLVVVLEDRELDLVEMVVVLEDRELDLVPQMGLYEGTSHSTSLSVLLHSSSAIRSRPFLFDVS